MFERYLYGNHIPASRLSDHDMCVCQSREAYKKKKNTLAGKVRLLKIDHNHQVAGEDSQETGVTRVTRVTRKAVLFQLLLIKYAAHKENKTSK